MRITWKDGVTTLATAGAIVLERAYFHNWDWPLISSMRWTMAGLAALIAVSFVFGYLLDAYKSELWGFASSVLLFAAIVLTGLGMYYVVSDYVVLLMVNAVVFWCASLLRHFTVHVPMAHGHA